MVEAPEQKRSASWLQRILVGRNPLWTACRILMTVAVVLVLFKYILTPIRVQGTSMEPTYKNGKVNVVNRLAFRKHKPQRGDIIAAEFAGPGILLLKRVIGLPGETVTVKNGQIYIDGAVLDEPYASGKIPWKTQLTLEPNQYFVIGDNRPISDRHTKYDYQILGKVMF